MQLIDSSVIVKFFAEEPGWEEAKEYMYTPISIELSMVELASGLLKKVRKNEFDKQSAELVLERCSKIFRFVEQKKHLASALDIAQKHSISVYDALFIAAALKEGYTLITCDGLQAAIAKKMGLKTAEC
jgi:predicted nucleic acid-binding protein